MSLRIASGKATETQDADCVKWFAQVFGRLLYAYLHPLLGADELSG
jgi:hypothetical protein